MEEQIILHLKELLEIEDRDVTLNDEFKEYSEWDSLANLSLMALIDEEYGVVISSSDFKKINTVGDLIKEIQTRISN